MGAWHLLRRHATEEVRRMFSMALWMAALVAPLQILAGDQHGLNSQRYQPIKIMALEGHYQSYPDGAPLVLFGLPDQSAGRMRDALEIPKLGSLILAHRWNAPMAGLDSVPRSQWPYVPLLFWTFRIMVGLAFAIFALGLTSLLVPPARSSLRQPRAAVRCPCPLAGRP